MSDKQATEMDSDDLEALFDQTRAEAATEVAAGSDDSADLEALFDQTRAATEGADAVTGDSADLEVLFDQTRGTADSDSGSGDSTDLEALFDQTAQAAMATGADSDATSTDSDDLEALFDQTAAATRAEPAAEVREAALAVCPAAGSEAGSPRCENIHSQLGHVTRRLHDTLHELGYDKSLEKTAQSIPDAQQRLQYIATMTEAAANRTLNAIELAQPIQDQLADGATQLAAEWDRMLAGQMDIAAFRQLVTQTRAYLAQVPEQTRHTNAQLMEIMMAQDFQDLTGQVIKKTAELAQQIETELLRLLIEFKPGERSEEGLLNGPVINGAGRTDVVMDQSQADELLESLGF